MESPVIFLIEELLLSTILPDSMFRPGVLTERALNGANKILVVYRKVLEQL